jgi:hypothetical protein
MCGDATQVVHTACAWKEASRRVKLQAKADVWHAEQLACCSVSPLLVGKQLIGPHRQVEVVPAGTDVSTSEAAGTQFDGRVADRMQCMCVWAHLTDHQCDTTVISDMSS